MEKQSVKVEDATSSKDTNTTVTDSPTKIREFSKVMEQTEAWMDDARMGNYMAEFRPYQLNPENYDAKMRFWKQAVKNYCEHKGSCDFTINELKRAFKRKNTSPYCLPTVIDDMLNKNEIQMKDEFLQTPDVTWTGWAMNLLVKKPIKWGVTKVKEQIMAVKDDNTSYVVQEVCSTQADALHNLFEKSYDIVLSKDDILNQINKIGLTVKGTEFAMHHLLCQDRLWIETGDDGKTLCKFAAPNSKVTPITQLERSIYTLEETEISLEKIINEIEADIDTETKIIKQQLKEGKKSVAKTHLKKRHVLEKNLEKRVSVLENVQTMLTQIHDTQKDKDVLSAYRIGTDALKNALAGSGITLDSVDETIEEMREVIEVHEDIQSTLAGPTKYYNEDDLEKELNDLLNEGPAASGGGGTGGQQVSPGSDNFDDEIERRLRALRPMTLPDLPPELGKSSILSQR